MALPELPEGLDPLLLEAELEERLRQHEVQRLVHAGDDSAAQQQMRVPGKEGEKQSFASLANQAYRSMMKMLESSNFPDAPRVDVLMRINAIFMFLATCVCWSLPEPDERLEEVLSWLMGAQGLQDVIKEWHADCKLRKGRDMSADGKVRLQAAFDALLEVAQQMSQNAIVEPDVADPLRPAPGDPRKLVALFAKPRLKEADVPSDLFGAPQATGALLQFSLQGCTAMLAELRAAYAEPDFHREYMKLRNSPSAHGQHVEFTLQRQAKVLEKYGFEPSLRGVIEMRAQTRACTWDAVILKLLRDIHALLEARKPLPKRMPWSFQSGWRPGVLMPGASKVQLVQSSWDTGERMTAVEAPQVEADFGFQGPVMEVDLDLPEQEILGFGAAFTEASALVFQGLAPYLQHELLDLYFGEDGIGFTLGRVHINSCDFSLGNYCFDPVEDDFDLEHFDLQVTRDGKALIPLIRDATARVDTAGGAGARELRLVASPWSPPAWMKSGKKMNGSEKPGLRAECQEVWAGYIAKWITAYRRQHVKIWAVTVQNEPEHNAPWEACCYTAQEEADFVAKHLGPTLRAMHPDVGIFVYDHNKDHIYEWARESLSHPQARPFIRGVAFHWYAGDHFEKLRKTHEEFPEAILLSTEACYERHRWRPGTQISEGDWSFGEGYAHDIMGNLNAGAVGWIDWNMLLDDTGGPNHVGNVCDAPMMASVTDQELHLHPQFFFLGHFSKYIPPGSKRLCSRVLGTPSCTSSSRGYGTCTAQDGLQGCAFRRPDGAVVLVLLNAANLFVNFQLRLRNGPDAPIRALRASIPARSVQTYLLPHSEERQKKECAERSCEGHGKEVQINLI
ncbi:unnamed protein product [Durusdinium trenchii]|uniref:Glucosylceramidase n=1 Tax=Durusdinium trenchii TaxID=1381693 RepID=A0ABP0QYC9_9DINO